MDKYYRKDFLSLLKGRAFTSEEEMEQHLESIFPGFFDIEPSSICSEQIMTTTGYLESKRSDIVIKNEDGQITVVFELKLHRYLKDNRAKSKAINQLHDYCQRTSASYGILLSEGYCKIFRYIAETRTHSEETSIPDIRKIKSGITEELNQRRKEMSEKFKVDTDIEKSRHIQDYKRKIDDISRESQKSFKEDREKHKKLLKFYTLTAIAVVAVFFIGLNYFSSKNSCTIKGNVSANGEKIYHTKESPSYADVVVEMSKGEKMFCSEKEAVEAGYKTWGKPQENTAVNTNACDSIKGNISRSTGEKIYHTKDSPLYKDTQIEEKYGEKIFCTEQDAISAGFRKWKPY